MRLRIDGEVCMGHGRCYGLAPDLVTYDDEGFPTIRDEWLVIAEDQAAAAVEMAETCPEEAILIVDE